MTQPQPPIRLSLEKSVLAVELFDLLANSRVGTYHREGSRCTFTDEIAHAQFRIVLRLDWGDMNDAEPMLDMDVVRIWEDGTLARLAPKKNPSHHTRLSALLPGSTEPRFYDIEFEGLSLRLVARKTFAISVSLSAYIVDPEAQPPS
jgi:hypothetical protein